MHIYSCVKDNDDRKYKGAKIILKIGGARQRKNIYNFTCNMINTFAL